MSRVYIAHRPDVAWRRGVDVIAGGDEEGGGRGRGRRGGGGGDGGRVVLFSFSPRSVGGMDRSPVTRAPRSPRRYYKINMNRIFFTAGCRRASLLFTIVL